MNTIKIIISLFLLLSVFSCNYDGDCEIESKQYTLKNGDIDDNGKYIDYKTQKNFTFIASNSDDCKNRILRKYVVISGMDSGKFYNSAKDQEDIKTEETNYKHCCYLKYDNMEKYEAKNVISEEYNYKTYKAKTIKEEKITGKCLALTEYQYNHIEDYMKLWQLLYNSVVNPIIDCSSSYLNLLILDLILLFLL